MTTVAHSTLTGSDLHEPKGADTATSGEIYIADGAGSGAWTALTSNSFKIVEKWYTATDTWTKPSGLIGIQVYLVGAGGDGQRSSQSPSSTFKSMSAPGGKGGQQGAGTVVGTGGDTNFTGQINTSALTTPRAPGFTLTGIAGMFGTIVLYGSGTDSAGDSVTVTTQGFGPICGLGQANVNGTGGGAGACVKWYAASALSSTEALTIGLSTDGSIGGALIREYITV